MATPDCAPEARTCRAVECTADGGVRVVHRRVPPPGPGELLLRLGGCGLCGTDLFKLEHATAAAGTVLGHELVGEVAALGDGVTGWSVGQRVVATHHVACGTCALCRRGADTLCPTFKENLLEPGGFSEVLVVRARAVEHATYAVPDHVADHEAVFLEPTACVLRGVEKAGIGTEGCAVVLGAGSMGLLHLLTLLAVRPGLRVVVADPVPERRGLAASLGAAVVSEPRFASLAEAVDEQSGGLGADAVFDTVGGSGPLEQAVSLTRPGGAVVLFAHAGAGDVAGFELNPFFKGERRLLATYSGGRQEQTAAAELLFAGRLDPAPLVTHRLPLSRFAEAVALSRQHRALKVLLVPG